MGFDIIRRSDVPAAMRIAAPILALIVAFLLGGMLVALMGRSPLQAFNVYLLEPLTQSWSIYEILIKATPLILIGIGLSFCFRANVWNIGAEGQFVVGAIAGGWVALGGFAPGWWLLPAVLVAGALGGLLYALVPAILRARLGVSEILTSLMLVYVAQLWLDYLVRGPWRDPRAFNFPQTRNFDPSLTLPSLIDGARLHIGILIALVVLLVAWWVMSRTIFGYRLRVTGDAPRAARFAGFSPPGTVLAVFAISGALAGLAGIIEVTGQIGQLKPVISPGYGFTAIIVAFLGRLHPVGILFAALVLSLTFIGGESAQIAMRMPFDVTRAFQGIVLFCVLVAEGLTSFRVVRRGAAEVPA